MKSQGLLIGATTVFLTFGVVIAVVLFSVEDSASAEQSSKISDVIGDWDFGGMSTDEKNAALHLMFPDQFTQAWLANRKPTDLAEDELSLLATTDPAAYVAIRPPTKQPGQDAKEQFDAWAISHPVEYTLLLNSQKSQNELDSSALATWAITNPEHAAVIDATARTPAQEAKHRAAVFSITHPVLKPRPLPKPERIHDF
jgi:hypothetical protein